MAFCPNCGKPISENAEFCGNCGKKTNNDTQPKNFKAVKNFDFKKILLAIKKYFLNFYVDYDSKIFKFAMILFMSIGLCDPIYSLINITSLLPTKVYSLFPGASTVYRFLICAILFAVFTVLILNLKLKNTIKKSNFLMIAWIVSTVLNFLVFLAGLELYEYIFFSSYASVIVELLMIVFSAALMFKNKPKYPFVLIISTLSFALKESYMFSIKMCVSFYKIWPTGESLLDLLKSLSYILLVLVLFLLVYIIPKKISKWLVCIPALTVLVFKFIEILNDFAFVDIISFTIDVCIIAMFVLFALSCSREAKYDYIIENKEKVQKSAVKVAVISVGSLSLILIPYLLISAIVCGMHINDGISKWKNQIISGDLKNATQWREVNRDIFGYTSTKFASQFIDDYGLYVTLKENRNTMEKISICYEAYINGNVDKDIIEKYSYIYIDEDLQDDTFLSTYYDKYMEMKPSAENVSVSEYVDVENGKIKITVKNENVMPISKCTVDCKFTILFVKSGYYSDPVYGRGIKTITLEDIEGNSKKTETITFDPDTYYDSYGSYILATRMDSSAELISIE